MIKDWRINSLKPIITLACFALSALATLSCTRDGCQVSLTLINASGLAITAGRLGLPGVDKPALIPAMPPSAAREFPFTGYAEGSYAVEITVGAASLRDTLGYVIPTAAFRDTLTLLPEGAGKRLVLKQSTLPCRDGFHFKSFLRRLLKRWV